MAIVFCNDDGSNTSPYDTWAKAATTKLVAVDFMSAGDDLHLGADHAESPSVNTTYNYPGTDTNPNRVISVTVGTTTYNKADNIQVDLAASGTLDMQITGHVKFYGVSFKIGDDLFMVTENLGILFDDCILELSRNNAASFSCGDSRGRNVVQLKNTDVNFSNSVASNGFNLNSGRFEWHGGTLSITGTQPSNLFNVGERFGTTSISSVDLSALTTNLFNLGSNNKWTTEIHHCLLNSGVSLTGGTITETGTRILMSGCDDTIGNSLQRIEYVDFWGSTVEDLNTYRNAGAKDGTINHSMKMVSTANATEFSEATRSLPLYAKIRTTGAKTFKIQCLWDSAVNIQNDEIYFVLEYLGAAANTQSTLDLSTRMANILSTPADHPTNSEAWTISPSMTNPNTFELSATVTINRVGPVIVHVFLAKPSTTIFVGPLMDVT